jgi:hypothetical protein
VRIGTALAALCLVAVPAFVKAQAPAADRAAHLQILVLTVGPGDQVWERFGHDAIWIRDTVLKTDAIYNYGMFDFADPGFIRRFALGIPRYSIGVDSSIDNTLAIYRYEHRNVDVQELNLTPAQRIDLATRLEINIRPENRYYIYNYFLDNCSTRVRDMLDVVLGGALRHATVGKPAAGTLRFHTLRSMASDKLLYLGIDLALGPPVDEPLDQWGEMFLPAKVHDRIGELQVPAVDGGTEPLVSRQRQLLTANVYTVLPAPPEWGGTFLAIGTVLALLIGAGVRRDGLGTFGRAVAVVWLLVAGVAGVILLLFWFATRHVATAGNHNLLFLDPLALLLIPAFWSRGAPAAIRRYAGIAVATAALLVVGVLLALVPAVGVQRNLDAAELLVLPMVAAVAVGALRPSRKCC